MTTSAAAQQLYSELIQQFESEGVVPGKLFGSLAFILDGSSIGCVKDGVAAFKLGSGSPALEHALGLPGATLFDPSSKGRPFRDWVAVPISDDAPLAELLEQAVTAVRA